MSPSLVSAARLRVAFAAAAIAWTATIVVTPLVASRAHASAAASLLAIAAYAAGSVVCHQLPQRSFHLWGAQLPVCARCTGIYFAAAVAAAITFARRRVSEIAVADRPDDREGRPNRAAVSVALAAAPTAATLLYEWTTGLTPGNWIRFAAGVPLGACAAWLLVAARRNQVN